MEQLLAALATERSVVPRQGGETRGRKPVHDKEWATGQLIILAGSVDGLPDSQTAVVTWLGERFEEEGKSSPKDTWLKKVVREFQSWALIRVEESQEKWAQSKQLQETFPAESDYLAFRRTRNRLEQKWLHSKALQKRYEAPAAYIAAVFSDAMLTNRESQSDCKIADRISAY